MKLSLQMVSVVPSLSTLTVGFRPIVIGYLHLVLLGVITIFLIGYFIEVNAVQAQIILHRRNNFCNGNYHQ